MRALFALISVSVIVAACADTTEEEEMTEETGDGDCTTQFTKAGAVEVCE